MKNRVAQDGCWNCAFKKREFKDIQDWDFSRTIYCDFDGSCPAVYVNWDLCKEDGSELAEHDEDFNTTNDDVLMERHMKLYRWRSSHEVELYEKCDDWKPILEKT